MTKASATTVDHRELGRAISAVEHGGEEAARVISRLHPRTGHASVVGITGPPGTGKSTLISRLITEWRSKRQTVAVVAIDPTSPISGGALLGDRIRMVQHVKDPGVFIRSMATRGQLGGLARAVGNAVRILDAAGFDNVVIETVGAGQGDFRIAAAADGVVVVLMPEVGDEVQTYKAGLLEIADILVLNKSDLAGADLAYAMLLHSAGERDAWKVPVLRVSAKAGEGLRLLVQTLEELRQHLRQTSTLTRRRTLRVEAELVEALADRYAMEIRHALRRDPRLARLVERVVARELDPESALAELEASYHRMVQAG